MSASDIVGKIVAEAGFSTQCESSRTVFKFMQQNNELDLDFIWRLANRIGFEFIVEDAKAIFRPIASTEPIELEYPKDIQRFTPRMTAVQQADQVTVRGWDPAAKQAIVVVA